MSTKPAAAQFENGATTAAFGYLFTPQGVEDAVNATKDVFGTFGNIVQGQMICGAATCNFAYSTVTDSFRQQRIRLSVYYPGKGDEGWIQTYTGTFPGVDDGLAHTDCAYTPCPFSGPDGNKYFDAPRRNGSGSWTGETSIVVPNQTGGYAPVATFSWGFHLSSGVDTPIAPHPVQPSPFQQQTIEGAHQ